MDFVVNEDIETKLLIDKTPDILTEDLTNSIRRALLTPLGYLSTFTLERDGLNYIDNEVGSILYELLAEPFSADLISQIHQGVQSALSLNNLGIRVSNISIQIAPPDSIFVIINIEELEEPLTISFNL